MSRPTDPSGPIRTCIGCRCRRPVADLARLGRVDGSVRFGRTLPGRGAWLCRASTTCLDQAARQGALARAFRAPVDPNQVDALRGALASQGPPPEIDFVPGDPAARD